MLTEEQILTLVRDKVDHPATARELLQILRVPREERATFKRRLRTLVASGALVEIRGNRFGLPDRMNLVVGRVATNPRGFGFVEPEAADPDGPGSIFIAGNNLNQAMHGDRVVVRVERQRNGDRAEGRILRILERGAEKIVGRYETGDAGLGFVVPFDRRLIMDVQVPRGETKGAAPGAMVTAQITRWPTATRPALGRVIEVIGLLDEPGVDTQVIIRKYGLSDEYPEAAVAEARRLGGAVRERDLEGIALSDEVAVILAQGVQSNVRELEGALIRLAAKASLTGRPINVEFVQAEMALVSPRRPDVMSVEDIQRAVCSHFRLSNSELLSKDRHKSVAFARQVAMYLCRQRLKCSFPELGRAFGNRDHTTVMSAVRRVETLRQRDPQVSAHLEAIEQRLASSED
jgi:hypothetical protein